LSSRRVFLGLPLGLLAGCGFQPVYGPGGVPATGALPGQNDPSLRQAMAAVRVAPMFERSGQVMRRTLQRNMEGRDPGVQGRYDLQVNLVFATEVLGFTSQGFPSRVRTTGTADWALSTLTAPPQLLERGAARTLDAFNIPDLQFFASDASREDMERRLIVELSDRVTVGVAIALRRHLAAPAAA